MKGVTFAGFTKRAGKLLDELMSNRLSRVEKLTMKVKRIGDDPVTWEFTPRDPRILSAWKKMDREDIEQGFILKACKGQSSLELASEFRLEVF